MGSEDRRREGLRCSLWDHSPGPTSARFLARWPLKAPFQLQLRAHVPDGTSAHLLPIAW